MNKNTKSCLLLRLAIIEGAVSLNIHNELLSKTIGDFFLTILVNKENKDIIIQDLLSVISSNEDKCCSEYTKDCTDSCSLLKELAEKSIEKLFPELDGAIDANNSGLFD